MNGRLNCLLEEYFSNRSSFLGDNKKQVHMEGYAVTAQCMALVRDNCLIPTKDAPELGYIRESSDKQYVPDVYYKVSEEFKCPTLKVHRHLFVVLLSSKGNQGQRLTFISLCFCLITTRKFYFYLIW